MIYFRHEPTLPAVILTVLIGIVDNPVKMPDSQGLKKAIAIVFSFLMLSPLHLSTSTGKEDPFVPWSHDTGASPRKEAVICGGPDYSANPSQRASAPLQIHTSCTNHYTLKWIQPSAVDPTFMVWSIKANTHSWVFGTIILQICLLLS